MHRAWLVGFVLVAALLSAPFFTAAPAAAQAPSITVVSPKVTTVSTLGFRTEVAVANFNLSQENYGGLPVPGQGHIHYTVDSTLGAGATWLTVFYFGSLTAGTHTVRAELRNNDHSALSPAVFQEITVTATAPSIAIVSPKVTTVSTLGFRMEVAVAGFLLDAANYAGTNFPGQGHIHYTVDGALAGGLAGATTSTVFNFGSLTGGAHTIRAELRNNDHSPLSPAVFQEMTVSVGPPEIRILEPLAGSGASALGFRMRVAVANFSLDPENYAGTNIAGRGHIHYTVDGTLAGGLAGATTATVFHFGSLTPGNHTVRAELRNNDHSALSPAVFQEMTVSVANPSIQIAVSAVSIQVGQPVTVTWTVSGFLIDPSAFGGPVEAGRGHVHVFVDGAYRMATAGDSLIITGLAAGSHTIKVALHNNDHSPLTTEVSSERTVQVTVPVVPEATVGAPAFYGTLAVLLIVIAALAVLLVRKGRGGSPEEKKEKEL